MRLRGQLPPEPVRTATVPRLSLVYCCNRPPCSVNLDPDVGSWFSFDTAQFYAPRFTGGNIKTVNFSRKTLILILLLAFSLRVGWMLYNSQSMENEGAEYARIAQNLLQKQQYNGILGGPESIFPSPLSSPDRGHLLRQQETQKYAGRAVSLAFGTLLVLPMFFISFRLFGLRTGYLSAIFVALHPFL